MNEENLKKAFSKVKDEMTYLSKDICELKKKQEEILQISPNNDTQNLVFSLQEKIGLLEHSLNTLEKSTVDTLHRLREEFNTKLEEEISSIRLELMDVIMKKEQNTIKQSSSYNF